MPSKTLDTKTTDNMLNKINAKCLTTFDSIIENMCFLWLLSIWESGMKYRSTQWYGKPARSAQPLPMGSTPTAPSMFTIRPFSNSNQFSIKYQFFQIKKLLLFSSIDYPVGIQGLATPSPSVSSKLVVNFGSFCKSLSQFIWIINNCFWFDLIPVIGSSKGRLLADRHRLHLILIGV